MELYIDIFGKILTLTILKSTPNISLFTRLTDRAHKEQEIAPLFLKAAKEVQKSRMPNPKPGPKDYSNLNDGTLFIHLPYHSQQPSRSKLKQPKQRLLQMIQENQGEIFSRIIYAFLRTPNIGDLCKRNQLEPTVNRH